MAVVDPSCIDCLNQKENTLPSEGIIMIATEVANPISLSHRIKSRFGLFSLALREVVWMVVRWVIRVVEVIEVRRLLHDI